MWDIEPSFRDTKDLRFGMGMGVFRIGDPQRRDRLLLLNAFAVVLLTLLVLLCHKLYTMRTCLNGRAQHGHLGRRRATATLSFRRMVAIELGM